MKRETTFNPRMNVNDGKPHRHRREIARRTTHPGTPERRRAMLEAAK